MGAPGGRRGYRGVALAATTPRALWQLLFDILLLDSVYPQAPVLQLAEEIGWDLVITLKQENRDLYQDAHGLFRGGAPDDHFAERRAHNLVEVQLWQAEDLPFTKDHPQPVRVVLAEAHFLLHGWLRSGNCGTARGTWAGGKITLLPGQSPAEEFATLAHETGHAFLHSQARRSETTKTVRETEAVAFVVCSAIGLETRSAAQDYIQLYEGDAKLLTESLEYVQRTTTQILNAISADDSSAPPA